MEFYHRFKLRCHRHLWCLCYCLLRETNKTVLPANPFKSWPNQILLWKCN